MNKKRLKKKENNKNISVSYQFISCTKDKIFLSKTNFKSIELKKEKINKKAEISHNKSNQINISPYSLIENSKKNISPNKSNKITGNCPFKPNHDSYSNIKVYFLFISRSQMITRIIMLIMK